ncbi:MAG: SAM-dependent DNA methyltransferase, partial [Bryobacteraceae bacterium]
MTSPLTPQDCVSAFIKRLTALDREKSAYEKFRDFCEMAFCACAMTTAPTPERAQEMEDRYMQIVGTYRDKDTVRAYPALLALAGSAIPQGCDFLGSVATELEVLNAQIGQFFTPYDVARMMAMMSLEGAADMIAANGFLTLQEPASGAGGMVLAAADTLAQQGFDPGLHMLVNAIDLSPLCFHMTYLQ